MARSAVIGGAQLRRKLAQAGPLAIKALASAMNEEHEKVMADSRENYVPVDDAHLKGSGTVFPPKISGNRVESISGYGGPAKDYALAVHEHLSEYSPPSWAAAEAAGRPVTFSPSGRGPKYLEMPFLQRAPKMPKALAKGVERHLQRLRT